MTRIRSNWLFLLGAVVVLFAMTTPVWASDGCTCDAQVRGDGTIGCNPGSCPAQGVCTNVGLFVPGQGGYVACSCIVNGTPITDSDCHTVVMLDGHGNFTGMTCSGDCPTGTTCVISNSACPGTPDAFECRCR